MNGLNVRDELKEKTVEELQTISAADRLGYSVLLFNLSQDLNIGNTIRSAHLLGAKRVIIIGDRKFDRRSCVGAQNYIEIVDSRLEQEASELVVFNSFIKALDTYNLYPLAIDKTKDSLSISRMSWPKDCTSPCLVFGNENTGIPTKILESIPTYHIEQFGVLRSFNVASAAAIAMYECSTILRK